MSRLSLLLVFVLATVASGFVTPSIHAGFKSVPTVPVTSETSLNLVEVVVGDGEPIESALRRFKRAVNKSGHLRELRNRRHFENKQQKAKRKLKDARMRIKFERMQRRRMQKQRFE